MIIKIAVESFDFMKRFRNVCTFSVCFIYFIFVIHFKCYRNSRNKAYSATDSSVIYPFLARNISTAKKAQPPMLDPEVFRVQKTGGPLVDLGIDCLSYCAFSLETDRVSRSLIIALVGNSGVNNGDRLPEIHFVFCLLGETILSTR